MGLFFLLSVCGSVCARSMLIPDANNRYDPVSGSRIGRRRFNTTYQGKRYWFNSYSNVRKFKEDPAKYMADYEEESRDDSETQERRGWGR